MSRKQRKELREDMRKIVNNLDVRWQRAANREVCTQLSDLINVKINRRLSHILAFQPKEQGSINLEEFLKAEASKGRTIWMPKGAGENFVFHELKSEVLLSSDFSSLNFDIYPDALGRELDENAAAMAMCIMPGIAFDNQGNRVGLGELSYEQLLQRSSYKQVLKVGVCWSLQMQPNLPLESYDLLVDWLCHEHGTLHTAMQFEDNDLEEEN